MKKQSFWQRLTAYPARRGLGGAIVIIVIGSGIILLQVVPPDLRTQGAQWLGDGLTRLTALDPHLSLSVVGGVLVLGGIVLGLLPAFRRTYRAYTPRIAPISVYYDYENQPISVAKIPAFTAFIKQTIGTTRMQCFYYTDETLAANKGHLSLSHYGFRLIQVAHKSKKLGNTNVKNMVDMALALHALERALLTRERQQIVIIAADRDYLPLLYRLRALGHEVSVWARVLPGAILALRDEIGITCVEFGDQFNFNENAAAKAALKSPAPSTAVTAPMLIPTITPASASAIITDVIERTLAYWQEASHKPADAQYAIFLYLLTSKANLAQIGFSQRYHARHWATVLKTLGILTQAKSGAMYARGPSGVEHGADILVQFLEDLVAVTQAFAATTPDGIIALNILRRKLGKHAKQATSELYALYSLTSKYDYGPYFLASARALGLIAYHAMDAQHIQVQAAPVVMSASPKQTDVEIAEE